MKSCNLLYGSLIFSVFLLSSCTFPVNSGLNSDFIANTTTQKSKFAINGKVEFPFFGIKATIEDIAKGATVTLLHPPDYDTESLRNTAIATGLTNEQGLFSISPGTSFNPQIGQIFVLDVIKRLGGPGSKILNLRTYIQWNGSNWDSITYPELYINRKTTAVSLISGLRPDKVGSSSLLKKFQIVNNSTQVISINEFATEGIINKVLALVDESLTEEQDTIGTILYDQKSDGFYREHKSNNEKLFPLVFSSNRQSATNIFFMNSNGSDQKIITSNFDLNADFYSPQLSPDNNKVVFVFDDFTKSNIWLINTDGTGLNQLTSDESFNSKPVWSPAGSLISFNSDRNGGKLCILNPETLAITESTISNSDFSWSSWSPDGSKVLFTSPQDGDEEIYFMNSDGTGLTKLTDNNFDDHSPNWSTDGNFVTFVSNRTGNEDIFVMEANGQNQENLTNTTNNNETEPSWTPDSTKIAFQSDLENQYDVYVINKNGTGKQKISNNPADDYNPRWLNNEELIYTSELESNREIFTANINQSVPVNISKNANTDSLISAFNNMD